MALFKPAITAATIKVNKGLAEVYVLNKIIPLPLSRVVLTNTVLAAN